MHFWPRTTHLDRQEKKQHAERSITYYIWTDVQETAKKPAAMCRILHLTFCPSNYRKSDRERNSKVAFHVYMLYKGSKSNTKYIKCAYVDQLCETELFTCQVNQTISVHVNRPLNRNSLLVLIRRNGLILPPPYYKSWIFQLLRFSSDNVGALMTSQQLHLPERKSIKS